MRVQRLPQLKYSIRETSRRANSKMAMDISRFLPLGLCLLATPALADPTTLTIPNQGWHVTFDAPPLTKLEESNTPIRYKYRAGAGRFNLSLFVELPGCNGGTTHKAVYDCLWPMMTNNPMLIKSSAVATSTPNFYKIESDAEAKTQNETIRMRNVNYLFYYRGKWMDLHISILQPSSTDLAYLANFEKSLTYGENTK